MMDHSVYKKFGLFKKIKYRWNNFGSPLPGETVRTIYGPDVPDSEKNIFLRRMRGIIGYGCGWTFFGALKDFLIPYIVYALSIVVLFYLSTHIAIGLK